MINIENVHHVAVNVTDVARARQFYADVLGLAQISRPDFDFPGAWFAAGNQQVHLIVNPQGAWLRADKSIDSRVGHFAVRVRSYRAAVDHLRACRVEFSERRHGLTPWPQIFITDPDGNVIELNAATLD